MACRAFILDFEKPGLFQAAEPETIAKKCRAWEEDISQLAPWTRIRTPRFADQDDAWTWQPETDGDGPAVLLCGHCTSTMDTAWHFAANRQMEPWDSVIATEQTAGRGQQKRKWISPAGNIHASWLWPLPGFNRETETDWGSLLPLIAGFVFARGFRELNVPVNIKWPNDLLLNDRKVGGILVERRESHILVGIGVNVSYSPEDRQLREESAVTATSLLHRGYAMTPLSLWMTLVEKGKFLFESLIRTATPDEFIRMIDTQMAWVGRNVLIRPMNGTIFEAVILGLSNDGGLRIKKGNMEDVVYSGSIIPG